MNSHADVQGAQRPRIELVPKAAYTDLGDDTIDLCSILGLELDPWQQYVVRGMMGERLDSKFAASNVGIVVPRQQGKGVILEARALAGLFLLQERLILWTAHELRTAQSSFQRLLNWINGNPELYAKVRQVYTGNTENAIVLKDGRKLQIMARTAGAGRGLSADCLIIDEAYALQDNQLAALIPTLTSSKNPQTIYTSSAGMPDSEKLQQLRERGTDSTSKSLAYFEWSAPDDADIDDMDALIMANPGLGTRLSLDHVADERASMDEETFKRERLGIWAQPGDDSFISPATWGGCTDVGLVERVNAGERVEQSFADITFAIDVSPDRLRASIGMAGLRKDGTVYVEQVDGSPGVDWLVSTVAPIMERRGKNPLVVIGGSNADLLTSDLRRAGVRVRPISKADYAEACGRFVDAVRERRVAHSSQETLNEAVAACAPSHLGDRMFTWKRTSIKADITPLVAVTIAAGKLWRAPDETVDDFLQKRNEVRANRLRPVRPRYRKLKPRGGG